MPDHDKNIDKDADKSSRRANVEAVQQEKMDEAHMHANEAAVLHMIRQLDPHADDAQLSYVEKLRRAQRAIDVELSKWTSAPVQPPGPSGEAAVAEPQQAE